MNRHARARLIAQIEAYLAFIAIAREPIVVIDTPKED